MQNEDFLEELHRRFPHEGMLRVKQSALLMVDMQEHFRPLAREILPPLTELIAACRRRGVPVIYTQHVHQDPARDGGMLAQWWGQVIPAGSFDAQLMPEIAPLGEDKVVQKNRYSAAF